MSESLRRLQVCLTGFYGYPRLTGAWPRGCVSQTEPCGSEVLAGMPDQQRSANAEEVLTGNGVSWSHCQTAGNRNWRMYVIGIS